MLNQNIFLKRVKELRENAALSQCELGSVIHISRRSVGNIENGRSSVSIKVLCDIADYFDVSVDFLMGRSDSRDYDRLQDDTRPLVPIDEL